MAAEQPKYNNFNFAFLQAAKQPIRPSSESVSIEWSSKTTKEEAVQPETEEAAGESSAGSQSESAEGLSLSSEGEVTICRFCHKKGHKHKYCGFRITNCSFCLGKHKVDDCRQKQPCARCLGLGHFEYRCPKKRNPVCQRCRKVHKEQCRVLVATLSREADGGQRQCFVCGSSEHFICDNPEGLEDKVFNNSAYRGCQKNSEQFMDKYYSFVNRFRNERCFNNLKLKSHEKPRQSFKKQREKRENGHFGGDSRNKRRQNDNKHKHKRINKKRERKK